MNTVTHEIHNSIQFWYSTKKVLQKDEDKNVDSELDINIWRLSEKMQRKTFLDIGIKILEPEKVEKVHFYFPFKVRKNDIKDLGIKLQNQKLLRGVFNENYSLSLSEEKYIEVKNAEDIEVLFDIYCLNVDSDIDIEEEFEGTIVSFLVKNRKAPRYFRFRLKLDDYGSFFETYRPRNSFFESAFIETEIVDFRINEKRNQDPNLVEKINGESRFAIKNINFFVMSPINDNIQSDGINLVYKRQLEMGGFWNDYLDIGNYQRMSVYKSLSVEGKGSVEDFNCFTKIDFKRSNISTISIYIIVLLVFTVCANIMSNMIWDYFKMQEEGSTYGVEATYSYGIESKTTIH